MLTILIRTVIIYVILVVSMRLMGKRQIAQLEVSDLVSTLLLSEIAALPVENLDIPVAYAIIPIITVMTFEILSSAAQRKFPRLKNLFSPRPQILVRMGTPDFSELNRARMSTDELMVALRRTGTTDIQEVAYAILEQDGSVSVIPRARFKNASAGDLGLNPQENGIFHIIIDDGTVNLSSLRAIGRDDKWLRNTLLRHGKEVRNVALMLADERGNVRLYCKEEKSDS